MKKLIILSVLAMITFNASANENAKKVTKLLIKDDIAAFKHNEDSSFMDGPLQVTAASLIKEFEDNRSYYERKYHKKLIRIRTVASNKKMATTGEHYVEANGKNQAEFILLMFKDSKEAEQIRKGQKLDLMCMSANTTTMHPSLNKCVKTEDYINKYIEGIMRQINKMKESDKPKNTAELLYLSLWEFDKQNPGVLKKYKTVDSLDNDPKVLSEIGKFVKSYRVEGLKPPVLPAL